MRDSNQGPAPARPPAGWHSRATRSRERGESRTTGRIALSAPVRLDAVGGRVPRAGVRFHAFDPPYDKSLKGDLERLGGNAGIRGPRFVVGHDGNPEIPLVTRSSDGQMLFPGLSR